MSNFLNRITAFFSSVILFFFVIGLDIEPVPSKEEYSVDLKQESVVRGGRLILFL